MTKKLRRIFAVILIIVISFSLSACNNLERERYEEDIDVSISTSPTSVDALLGDISAIAADYADDLVPMHINIVFDGEEEIASRLGTIDFTFGHYNEEENISTIVIITYDMLNMTATNVSYEQGNAAFETDLSNPVNEQIMQSSFADIFTVIENDDNYSGKLHGFNVKLTIQMTSENMTIEII